MTLETELELAIALARRAGALVLRHYSAELQVQIKDDNSPVTLADRQANELITRVLAERFPDDGILAEESTDQWSWRQYERVWMVDPLDGTKEFIRRNGEFAVMIGLLVGDRPRLGVVYQPTKDRLYAAATGQGCTLTIGTETVDLRTSSNENPAAATMVMSRSHGHTDAIALAEKLAVKRLVRSGSVGIKIGLIATMAADIYVHFSQKTKLWDSCAPTAILSESGGRITDTRGSELNFRHEGMYNQYGLLATNGGLHETVLDGICTLDRAS